MNDITANLLVWFSGFAWVFPFYLFGQSDGIAYMVRKISETDSSTKNSQQ